MESVSTDTAMGMAEKVTVVTPKVYSSRIKLIGSVRFGLA
jgi:hypothetical protein